MGDEFRKGVLVRKPFERLAQEEILAIDHASLKILEDTGIVCFNDEAAGIFDTHACLVERNDQGSFRVRIPEFSGIWLQPRRSVRGCVMLHRRQVYSQ